MNKKQIVRICGIVSTVIFALGGLFPIASIEFLGTKITVSLLDGSDWIFVILNALLCLVGFLLTEDIVIDACGLTAGLIAYGRLHVFFDDSTDEIAQFITKEFGFYCLLVGAVLMIVLGTVFTFMKDPEKKKEQPTTRKCPFCAETIKADAIICRFCGSKLEGDSKESEEDIEDDEEEPEEKLKRYAKKGGRLVVTIILVIASLVLCGIVLASVLNGGSLPTAIPDDDSSISEPISDNDATSIPEANSNDTVSTSEQTTTTSSTSTTTTTTTTSQSEPVVDFSHNIEACFVQNDGFTTDASCVPSILIRPDGTFDFECNLYFDVLTYTGTWERYTTKWGTNLTLTITGSDMGNVSDKVKKTPLDISYFPGDDSVEFSYWKEEIESLKSQIKTATQQEASELERKLHWMEETEMAVVISQDQNEIQTFGKWKLDIKPHREKIEKRELDKEFKDKDKPLRVVFVCAMWLTGFDVKCLSCLYLDKPLKAHTLMQTIARANRVAEGKSNGLIIDYIGIVKALRKALADYTANNGGKNSDPTIDKEELIKRIKEDISKSKDFLKERGFILKTLIDAQGFAKIGKIRDGADAVCGCIEDKKKFSTYASELIRLVKYTDRSDIGDDIRKEYEAIAAIFGEIKKKRKHVDITDLMVEINNIINDYVRIEEKENDNSPSKQFDISKIDFDLLAREFLKSKRKNLILKDVEELIQKKLDAMLAVNPNRMNYYDRYQKIIADYNSEQDRATIEKTFMDLMNIASELTEEEQRYVREGFQSDEELSLYEMLFSENLSKADIKAIKAVAVDLLKKIKDKIAELDHWTDKQETKAAVDNLIRDTLWEELPESYDEISISNYRQKIYEYVYTRYRESA